MTIAACYLSSEGVVLGADSTSTLYVAGPNGVGGALHHLNYAQKVFEVGRETTMGVTMWGMGAIGDLSHRSLIAEFADELRGGMPESMDKVAQEFATRFWGEYSTRLGGDIEQFNHLVAKGLRSEQEEENRVGLLNRLSGGFCVAGRVPDERAAHAHEILYNPYLVDPPIPKPLRTGTTNFWGCPNIVDRVLYGLDESMFEAILKSGKWTGTEKELFDVIWDHRIAQPWDLPLREAVDWVNAAIYTTVKAMKFSHLMPVCGGPIEIAVISTDRNFRWVRHKRFDDALQ